MSTNDQRLVGTLQHIYETSKLTSEWNSEVIQYISHYDARIRYNSRE